MDTMFWVYTTSLLLSAATGIAALPWDIRTIRDTEAALRAVQDWWSPVPATAPGALIPAAIRA